jgi:hypothetical protein
VHGIDTTTLVIKLLWHEYLEANNVWLCSGHAPIEFEECLGCHKAEGNEVFN